MINKQNIEEYFFDYFEGNLTAEQKVSVELFLKSNPEYQSDFNAWKDAYLPQENFVYQHADELLRPEAQDKRSFFGRWKTSLLMLLVGTGMSAGVFYTLQGTNSGQGHLAEKKNKEKDSKLIEKITKENAIVESEQVTSNGVNGSEVKNQAVTPEQDVLTKADNKITKTVASGKSNKNANKAAKGLSGKRDVRRDQLVISTEGAVPAEDLKSIDNYRKGTSNLKAVDLIAGNFQELGWSAPELGRSRNSLEKYDKNVVKFQNDGDPYLNVPNTNALETNGGFAGNGSGVRANYLYSIQWPELNDYFSTHKASVDAYVDVLKGGVGLVFTNDVLGHNKFTTNSIGLIYSPKLKLGAHSSVEPYVNYTYTQKSISWNQVKSKEVIDPRVGLMDAYVENIPENIAKSKSGYSDAGVGVLINTSKLYFGFSYQGLLNPSYNFEGYSSEISVPGKFVAQVGGSVVPFKNFENFVLSPSVYFVKLGAWDNLWFTNVVEISKLFIGTSVSLNSDAYFSLGYNNDRLRVSYNYGLAKAPVNMTKHLSIHQLGLSFCLNKTN